MSYAEPRCLEEHEIKAALSTLKSWSGDQQGLTRKLVFPDFRAAMRFMQSCIEGIEERDHHPAWCNVYNSIEIKLNTHSAGNRVTAKDIDLARFLDSVLENHKHGPQDKQ